MPDIETQDKFRELTLKRDGYRCRYCGYTHENGTGLQAHHIHRQDSGGVDELSNSVTLCDRCYNALHALAKGAVVPVSVLSDYGVPKDHCPIRGFSYPICGMVMDVLKEGRDKGKPWGYANNKRLADRMGVRRQYVQRALENLTAAGWVEKTH